MIIFEDIGLVVAIVSLFWGSLLVSVIRHYKKETKTVKTAPKTGVKEVVSIVRNKEELKDIVRQIIPYTLKGKKPAIKRILNENKINYQWD